ncbi:hypothetical protein L0775_004054 [Clostridioides difficile]|nr:hypothetical protein [Clostridioides difficile]EIS9627555.1 hypothetical protein [Clostridioides difficile]
MNFLNHKENNIVKDSRIEIRLTSYQKETINKLAKYHNMTRTDYLLYLVNQDLNNINNDNKNKK